MLGKQARTQTSDDVDIHIDGGPIRERRHGAAVEPQPGANAPEADEIHLPFAGVGDQLLQVNGAAPSCPDLERTDAASTDKAPHGDVVSWTTWIHSTVVSLALKGSPRPCQSSLPPKMLRRVELQGPVDLCRTAVRAPQAALHLASGLVGTR